MKKLLSVFFGVLACLPFFYLASSRYQANREALKEVGNTLINSEQHQEAIAEGGARVLIARYNSDTIARATKYMSTFGSGTGVFQEIARIAAEADRDCTLLDSVLDLAARSTSNSKNILELAEGACTAENTPDDTAWFTKYEKLLGEAYYPSIEAAIADQRKN